MIVPCETYYGPDMQNISSESDFQTYEVNVSKKQKQYTDLMLFY